MKIFSILAFALAVLATSCGSDQEPGPAAITGSDTASIPSPAQSMGFSDFRTGDVIFQVLGSASGRDITLATGSEYNHLGMIYQRPDKTILVIEAGLQVQSIPLDKWLDMGKNKYILKRLNNSDDLFSERNLKWMTIKLREHRGKMYDTGFDWDNEQFYAAELVWKLYKEGLGIELGQLQTLGGLDLTSPEVSAQMMAKYGDDIPLDMEVISPAAILNSTELFLVHEN
jgi:hypothetical protein